MAKRKNRQYNGQKEGQTIQWPKERTDNSMAKRKDRQYNGQMNWSLYCLSFLLAIVLSVLSFGHCIVCPFFWPLYCLSFWPKERTDNKTVKRKDRQYNGQKEGQTIQWPKERTDNTTAKRKDRQYNGQKKGQTIQWPKEACPFFWPLYCLSFLLAIALSVLSFGHCIVCPFFCTTAKRKDRQYNGQKKGQTIQWPKERTNNTMAKRKDKQYNGQKKGQTGHCIIYPFFWSLYCLSFLLAIVLSVLSFGHCIVCPFFWPVHCLSFLLVIVLSVLSFGHCERTNNTMTKRKDRKCNDQKKGQTIQWPKERIDNTVAKRKDRQYNGQKKGQTIQWPKVFVLSFGHCIVCPFFWSVYFLSFLLAIALSVLSFGHCMTKRKDRQYNGQKKGQTIQWPKERIDNTMVKRKDRQYNGQKKVSFLLVIALSVLSFGQCIFCHFFWALHCLSFLFTMAKRKDRQYNGQKKG
jgi:heme/copper-type cytochrome/quinol oxidase subunit 4